LSFEFFDEIHVLAKQLHWIITLISFRLRNGFA
jgi:hypothetical protein